MTALWILLGLVALAAALLLLPIRLELFYDVDGFSAQAHVGPLPIPVPGGSKRDRDASRSQQPQEPNLAAAKPSSAWKRLLLAHWREAVRALGDLLRRPALTQLELEIRAGGADPAACAMAYGRSWAAVGSALPLVRSIFRVGKEQIQVVCDDSLTKTTVRGRAVFTLRVFELLQALLVLAKLVRRLQTSKSTTKKAVQQP